MTLLGEAERQALALEDRPRLARVLAYSSRCFWWLGQPEAGQAAGERSLAIARDLDDELLEATANYHLGLNCLSSSGFVGVEVYRRTAEILRGPLALQRLGMPALPAVIGKAWLGYGLACVGDITGALAGCRRCGRACAEPAGHPYSIVVALAGVGMSQVVQGHAAPARQSLEQAEAAASWHVQVCSMSYRRHSWAAS